MWLRFTAGERVGEALELTLARTVVGREEGCDVRIEHEKVSRRHAAFERTPDGRFQVVDLGSTNGTFVDGVRLAPNEPRLLTGGEEVRVGDTVLAVSATEPGKAAPTVVSAAPPTRISAPQAAPPSAGGRLGGGLLAGPGKWIAIALSAAALAGGGIAAGLLLTGGENEAASTTPAPPTVVTVVVTETLPPATTAAQDTVPVETTPADTSSAATLTDAENALLLHVPEAVRPGCIGRGEAEDDPAGTVASVYCETAEGIRVWYFQMDVSASMLAEYERLVGATPRDSGQCGTDAVAESTYSQDDTPAGRYFCFDAEGFGSGIAWTNDPTAILTEAALASGDRAALFDWWASAVNPLP